MQIDVRPDHLELIKNALKLHVPDRQVVAFGSRVKWTAKDTSDLDICVMGEEKIPFETMAALRDELSNSNLPYKVDVVDWASIKPDFRKIIAAQSYEIKAPEDKGWSYKRLSDAALISPPVKLAKDVNYPFVDMAAIEPGKKFVEPSEQRAFSGGGSRFAHGDTLLARITPCLENGKIAMFHGNSEGEIAHGSTEFIVFRGRPGVSDNEFIYYLVTSPEVRSFAIGQMTGSSGRQRVPTSAFDSITVGLPPLREQQKIVAILKSIDDKIDLNIRMNESLEEAAQSIFKSWFVNFEPVSLKKKTKSLAPNVVHLFPDKLVDSNLGQIPIGWKIGKIEDLLILQRGFDLPHPQRTAGDYPVIAASGINGTHNQFMVKGPGVTTGRSGILGNVFYVSQDFWPLNTSLWVKEFKHSTPLFAYFFLKEIDFKIFNAGSAVPTLNRNHIHSLPAVIPPKTLINKFEELAVPLFKRKYENEEQNKNLTQLRNALLPKLISGELRVSDTASKVKEAV